MVRPAGFEPAASWFVVKRYWTQGFLFNSMVSAEMPHFGPFAVNWVGIWVGKNPARQSPMVRFAGDSVLAGRHSAVQALDVIRRLPGSIVQSWLLRNTTIKLSPSGAFYGRSHGEASDEAARRGVLAFIGKMGISQELSHVDRACGSPRRRSGPISA